MEKEQNVPRGLGCARIELWSLASGSINEQDGLLTTRPFARAICATPICDDEFQGVDLLKTGDQVRKVVNLVEHRNDD